MKRYILILLVFAFVLSYGSPVFAEEVTGDGDELAKEIKWLQAELIIFSASRREQKVADVPAAVYVISSEEIRRSGHESIPELLRMVPGLTVARINSNEWGVASRGFNGRQSSNKLLILIDGRSVYSPLFSGVYWDVNDVMIEDIERIEVIRGPGGTMWGAYAINGVINIITKSAMDTEGGLLSVGAGTEDKGFGSFRYGASLSEDLSVRAYVKYFNRDNLENAAGEESHDAWDVSRAGARMDWEVSGWDTITLQGDIYTGNADRTASTTTFVPFEWRPIKDTIELDGENLQLSWRHEGQDGSEFIVKTYFDRAERKHTTLHQLIDTYDIDLQHRFSLTGRNEVTWGGGYRVEKDRLKGTFGLSFDPGSDTNQRYSVFVQDEFSYSDALTVIIGTKLETNTISGGETEPGARVLYRPKEGHTFWGSVAKAVRTPSRFDRDVVLHMFAVPGEMPMLGRMTGDHDPTSEKVLAYEVGYRSELSDDLSIDLAAFYNVYDDHSSVESREPFMEFTPEPMHLVIPIQLDHLLEGQTHGFEAAVNYRASDKWRLFAGYAWLSADLNAKEGSTDEEEADREGNTPDHQIQLRSYYDLTSDIELDGAIYYYSKLKAFNVPSYVRFDLRAAWRPIEDLEVSLVGQNLLDKGHPEFEAPATDIWTEVPRSVYAKATWEF